MLIGDEKDGARYPYGLGADRSGAANLVVHDNYLYIGGYNDPMIALPSALQGNFEELYKDLDSPVCLWRMDTDENIELVAGEANDLFPEVKGNMGPGLGSNLNQYVWRMESYDSKLYVGTFDIGGLAYPLMQFTNGDILHRTPDEWKTQFEYIIKLLELLLKSDDKVARSAEVSTMVDTMQSMTTLLDKGGANDLASTEKFYSLLQKAVALYEKVHDYLPESVTEELNNIFNQDTVDNFYYFIGVCKYLSKGERGFDLLVSEDGVNFDVITRNGMGDPNNHGCRVFAKTDAGLCLGTANPFYGTQLWRLNDLTTDTDVPSEEDTTVPTQPDTTVPEDTSAPDTTGGTAQAPDTTGTVNDPVDDSTDATQAPAEQEASANAGENPNNPETGEGMTGIALATAAVMAGGVLLLLHRKKEK